VAVIGPSGCGKSSLLDVLALAAPVATVRRFLFRPEDGTAFELGRQLMANDLDGLAEIRRHFIGYVLQTGGLLPFLNVFHNIGLLLPWGGDDTRCRVAELAEALGISPQLRKLPANLSAGERQRVAIGRALATRPAAILADEPTAALDPITSDRVMQAFMDETHRVGGACIVATHDWDRVKRLGMRQLQHRFESTGQAGWTRSVMHD
jgi:putative ABC transport system ATP-binding protein